MTYLQLISDVVNAFMDGSLSPSARLEKMWHSVFITRIWRHSISKQSSLTLKGNFMSSFSYNCIEINAHSLVLILKYLKKERLTHLFLPHLYSSQPCESFYRKMRSLTTTNSTITNFSIKEFSHRVSRVQILNEISNDKGSGFNFPIPLRPFDFSSMKFGEEDFPTDLEIFKIIQKCKQSAIKVAKNIGLLKKGEEVNDAIFSCKVPSYVFVGKKWEDIECSSFECDITDDYIEDDYDDDFHSNWRLMASSLKNYAKTVKEGSVSDISPYAEIFIDERRFVFKKTSICGIFGKASYKCSNDRLIRVRNPKKVTKAMKRNNVKILAKKKTNSKYTT